MVEILHQDRHEVNDIEETRHSIECSEFNQAAVTPGDHIAPGGYMASQFQSLLHAAQTWMEQMHGGKLNKLDSWVFFTSALWRTICYLLPVTTLIKRQRKLIMSTILNCLLPSIGVCKSFPSCGPFAYFGLGLPHL